MSSQKITLKPGNKGWFERKFDRADVYEIVQEVEVEVVEHSASWYKTVGHVPGFPVGHPPLLIPKQERLR